MKAISIGELHRRTGNWVRSVARYGGIVVLDRNKPVAQLLPVTKKRRVKNFEDWKPLKRFAAALDRPVIGRPVQEIISQDRER